MKNQHELNRCRMYVFLHAIPLFTSGVLPEAQYVECKWVWSGLVTLAARELGRRVRLPHCPGMIPGTVDISMK